MKTIIHFTTLLLLILTVGCFPVHQRISPEVSGVVIDAQSHLPISGAEAVIAYAWYKPTATLESYTNTRPPTVFTKADGSFTIPAAQRRIWVTILPIDYFYPGNILLVKAQGYVPAIVPVSTIGLEPTNVNEILLVPKP
jgi:hypothetical protein